MPQSTSRELALSFFTVGRIIREKLHHNKKRDPFTLLKLLVLKFLTDNPELKIKDIAEYLSITPPSATSLINNLAKDDFLKRKSEEKDRRKVHLEITDKGKKVLKKGMEEVEKEMIGISSALNDKEQITLLNLLNKIINSNGTCGLRKK